MHESALHVFSNSQGARVVESERAVGLRAASCNTMCSLAYCEGSPFVEDKGGLSSKRGLQRKRLRERVLLCGTKGMRSERCVLVLAYRKIRSRFRGRASGALATAHGLRVRVQLCVDEGVHSKRAWCCCLQ